MQNAAHVERHQFVSTAVPEHGDKSVVAIEQIAVQGCLEHTFLRLLKQHAVLFFRHLTRGRIVHHVDRTIPRTAGSE